MIFITHIIECHKNYAVTKSFRNDFPKIQDKTLKTAGFGEIYVKTTVDGKTRTSCMTDQNGPEPGNFRPCQFYEVGANIYINIPWTFRKTTKSIVLHVLLKIFRVLNLPVHMCHVWGEQKHCASCQM